jgi:signal transduction histidine kinase
VQSIDDAERTFRARYLKWIGVGAEKNTGVRISDHPPALEAGTTFFENVNDSFLPQIRRGDYETAQQLFDNELTKDYRTYRDAVRQSRAALAVQQRNIEDAAAKHIARRLLIMGLGAAVAIGFAAGLGFVVARSISRPVLKLTEQASRSANEELPRAIIAVQSGAEGALSELTPISSDSTDEFGELAGALNAMQSTAVELATEQASARRAMAENLVHIGRRNQSLIDRTLGFISKLERDEQDPEVLANLFRLDHLTTRMRRGSESLLVLAGSEPSTRKRSPEEIADVVRGALSEIESYDRIDFSSLDDTKVTPGAVRPLAHLLAELLENAANFSPPSTRVTVLGHLGDEGYHLSIIDRGIGMEPDKLAAANETLAGDSEFLTVSTKMLGHHVVARLATRLGITVRLEDGKPGVTASVLLPMAMLLTPPVDAPREMVRPSKPQATATSPKPEHARPEPAVAPARREAPAVAVQTRSTPTPPPPPVRKSVKPPPPPVRKAVTPPPPPNGPARPATAPASAPVPAPSPAPAPATPAQVSADAPQRMAGGYQRRVRGAQLPDLGADADSAVATIPRAEEQRAALGRFQQGVNAGLKPNNELADNEREQP